ncbi:MAG: class II aldolase/adducin family protein [candidate division WOR-3 bacterium]
MMKLRRFLKEIKRASKFIHEKKWACASEGNLSVLLNEKYILITSKGAKIRDLIKNPVKNLSLIKIEENKFTLIKGKEPSSETLAHFLSYKEILKNNLKENYLLHLHPENIIAISHLVKNEKELNKILKGVHFEFEYFFPEGIGFIKEKKPGSIELARENAKKISKYKCVIWKKHGIISRGKSFEECIERIEILEKIAGIYLKLFYFKKFF